MSGSLGSCDRGSAGQTRPEGGSPSPVRGDLCEGGLEAQGWGAEGAGKERGAGPPQPRGEGTEGCVWDPAVGAWAGASDSGPLSKADPRGFDDGQTVGWGGRGGEGGPGFWPESLGGKGAMGQIRGVVSCRTRSPLEA